MSSSSSVCQGLRSSLEPWLTEPCIERLKSIPSKPNPSRSISPSSQSLFHTRENTTTTTIIKTNDDCNTKSEKAAEEDTGGGWSFLQCLTNNNNNNNNNNNKEAADGNEKVYVHPFVKRSSSMLSEKSLEMCTESLGSETGSSLVSDDGINTISSSTAGINNYTPTTTQMRESNLVKKKRTNRSRLTTFPPPLTSISCSNRVKVRPHREGGRLVLQAVTDPSPPPTAYFQAERCDGRLRLCLVKDLHPSPPNEEDIDDEEEEEEDYCCDHVEDVEGKIEKDRGEIGIENLPRPSRCCEGGRGAGNRLIWEEAFWVST